MESSLGLVPGVCGVWEVSAGVSRVDAPGETIVWAGYGDMGIDGMSKSGRMHSRVSKGEGERERGERNERS